MSKTNLKIALDYINHGWSIIPIVPDQKTPLIKSWLEFQKRQPTVAEVTEWFTQWPNANIAIVVGRVSGLVVIDIDDPVEGEQSFRKYFGNVTTLTVKTPRGIHYYFKHPGDRPINNSIRAAPGLDVKADGGYVLAPPSKIAAVQYKWIKHNLVDLPQQTLTLDTQQKQKVDLSDAGDILKGGRNNTITRRAGKLLALGHSKAETLVMCQAFNVAYCKPPLPEFEVKSIVESISSREAQKPPKFGELIATRFSDIEEEKIQWIWPGVIPRGKLSLLIGDPGHGKSLLSIEIAACISSGKQFPDGTKPEIGNVLMVFCEDEAGDTVKPRLRLAGANLNKISCLTIEKRFIKLDTDLVQLEEVIKQTNAALLIIDPISAYLGNVNSWKDDEVRHLLAGIGDLAAKTKCSILCIMHLNKKVSSNAIDRGMGSIAFTAVARSVFLVGAHPEEHDSRKILAPVKANLVEAAKSRMFRINSSDDNIPYIEWDGETSYTAREILLKEITGLDESSNLEKAIRFIEDQLKNGEKAATLIYQQGEREGLSQNIITAAKKQLGVKSNRQAEGTFWILQSKKNDFGF